MSAVKTMRKKLGLKGNSLRQRKSAPAPRLPAQMHAPVPVTVPHPAVIPVKMSEGTKQGQVIPITFFLTLEVNVKVNTEQVLNAC